MHCHLVEIERRGGPFTNIWIAEQLLHSRCFTFLCTYLPSYRRQSCKVILKQMNKSTLIGLNWSCDIMQQRPIIVPFQSRATEILWILLQIFFPGFHSLLEYQWTLMVTPKLFVLCPLVDIIKLQQQEKAILKVTNKSRA